MKPITSENAGTNTTVTQLEDKVLLTLTTPQGNSIAGLYQASNAMALAKQLAFTANTITAQKEKEKTSGKEAG